MCYRETGVGHDLWVLHVVTELHNFFIGEKRLTHQHPNARTHTLLHTNIHTHTRARTHTHTSIHTHTLSHTRSRAHAHTHTHTHTHTLIDTNPNDWNHQVLFQQQLDLRAPYSNINTLWRLVGRLVAGPHRVLRECHVLWRRKHIPVSTTRQRASRNNAFCGYTNT